MTSEQEQQLIARAQRVREHIIRMATDGGCFIGASLSCTDLLVYLYSDVLRVAPSKINDPNRDYFFLSKGHDVPALYGTLVELGFIPRNRLDQHLKTTDLIYWHPNRTIPGVEFHSGSLGHLLAVALGVAYDIKSSGEKNRVFVILGDGELDEGSIWESSLLASAHKLDNLIVIIDRNEFQANMRTEELVPLEPIGTKFGAFGWNWKRIDGHNFSEMEAAFRHLPFGEGKPSVIIANTVRGKGLPSIERQADRWFANFTHQEVEMLLDELSTINPAVLTSESLMVR
jgi:transketolase